MSKLIFFFVICLFVFVSCSITEEPELVTLDKNTFADFKVNIWQDYSVGFGQQKTNNSVQDIILENTEQVTEALKNSHELIGVKYKVNISDNALLFSDFKTVTPNDLEKSKSGRPVSIFDNVVWDCLAGQKLMARCYTEQCVTNTLTSPAPSFSAGETITIHHGGVAGFKICSNAK